MHCPSTHLLKRRLSTLSLERSVRYVLAVEHSIEGDFADARIGSVDRFAQVFPKTRHRKHSAAGSDHSISVALRPAMENYALPAIILNSRDLLSLLVASWVASGGEDDGGGDFVLYDDVFGTEMSLRSVEKRCREASAEARKDGLGLGIAETRVELDDVDGRTALSDGS